MAVMQREVRSAFDVDRSYARSYAELEEVRLVERARRGDSRAMNGLLRRYTGFVRLKASSYFLAGGDGDDLVQEGLIGLYKAVRDYRSDKEASFRSFAELCITRQIITAIKTATRNKHVPLNSYVSFSHTPSGREIESDCTVGDTLPGSEIEDPAAHVISTQELRSLVDCLSGRLSHLESQVLAGYLAGDSYEIIASCIGCDAKTVDNALQRIKRKVGEHLERRRIVD